MTDAAKPRRSIKEQLEAARQETNHWPEWERREIEVEVRKTPVRDAAKPGTIPHDAIIVGLYTLQQLAKGEDVTVTLPSGGFLTMIHSSDFPRIEDLLRDAECNRPRRLDEYHEDCGQVLWWTSPISEPPYVGSPLCNDWPGYHTHWTVISEPHFDAEIAREKAKPESELDHIPELPKGAALTECQASMFDGECAHRLCPVDWKAIKTGADPSIQCPLPWHRARDGEDDDY